MAHAPLRNTAASFKPLLPSPRSRLSTKPLTSGAAPSPSSSSPRRSVSASASSRRDLLLLIPSLAAASAVLRAAPASAAADDQASPPPPAESPAPTPPTPTPEKVPEGDESAVSRVYDATVIGEPQAVGREAKGRVWDKLAAARVVYLGEAELVPDPDDRVLELEIVTELAARCAEAEKRLALALEAFPCDLQQQLDDFMSGRIDGSILKLYTSHWPSERWQEYEPLLNFCRDNGIKLVASGTPLQVKRTVQAEGIGGLSKAERKEYAPPAGSGFISGFRSGRSFIENITSTRDSPFGPNSYLSAQARVVDDYTMSQIIMKELNGRDPPGMLIVVAGASHLICGSRGTGVPARVSKKLPKKGQVVVLLDPERQSIRREGQIPVADFLWYSAAKTCTRNCFDRAEIARVMSAAGRRPEALPQDLQKGIDLGVVSPEILQNFFDLDKNPVMTKLIHRFQSLGFVKGLLGSLPDNAFQKNTFGQNWNMNQRVAAVIVGGLKLAGVGFISSVGAGVSSDLLYAARGVLKPSVSVGAGRKRAPVLKSAAVYSCFLGTSANLRYQIIAGLLEHRLGESLATRYNQPLLAGLLSFVARTANSYLGTQQWVDLARYTGIQKIQEQLPSEEVTTPPETSQLEGGTTDVQNLDDSSSSSSSSNSTADQSSDPTK